MKCCLPGDDLNDVKALRAAGIGVAVANAQDRALEAADYITKGECYHGVMEAVDRFVLHDNSLRRQSYSLPGLLAELTGNLRHQAKVLAEEFGPAGLKKVMFLGCGDSHAAAMTMRHTWQQLTGIPAEVMPVIDFSRCYPKENLTRETLVVIVSVSGNPGFGSRRRLIRQTSILQGRWLSPITRIPGSEDAAAGYFR